MAVLWVTWWVNLVCLGFEFCCFSLIEFVVLGFNCGCLLVWFSVLLDLILGEFCC